MRKRASGVILHITSLPGPFGMGTLGHDARQFVDFLERSGQTYWQILPLVNPGRGESPYMSSSSAAGNILLIDPDMLAERGLLDGSDLEYVRYNGQQDYVDFPFIHGTRIPMLRKAFSRVNAELQAEIDEFAEKNADWLNDYALYMAISDHFGTGLQEWPDDEIKLRNKTAIDKYSEMLSEDIAFYKFTQYLFFEQWTALKKYANDKGIKIFGDIPIYVSPDSVDVWTSPEMFRLDKDLKPEAVAGVPPDVFSATGQLWGNPLYDWEYQEKTGYSWWMQRVKRSLAFYDLIRIDHFRGFSDYWEIPAGSAAALDGRWKEGPRMKFIDALLEKYPKEVFVAEDLGVITDECEEFFKEAGFTGMWVLVDSLMDTSGSSRFLPHNAPPNSVIYTCTHDTPTFVQWYTEVASSEQRAFVRDYMRCGGAAIGWGAIACAWSLGAETAMTTMQDILCLGRNARMNLPGTEGGSNWCWRVRYEALNDTVAGKLRYLTKIYGRLPEKC